MKRTLIAVAIIGLWAIPVTLRAAGTYCPQGSAFIQVGMSENDVLSACGDPSQKSISDRPAMRRVPITVLIYTNINPANPYPGLDGAFYQQWSLPRGKNDSFHLQVELIDHKVTGIKMNGSGANAMTMCPNGTFQEGDNESRVYAACGNPETTNNTFKEEAIPSKKKPEIWIYTSDPYQPSIHLTFVDGRLESIN